MFLEHGQGKKSNVKYHEQVNYIIISLYIKKCTADMLLLEDGEAEQRIRYMYLIVSCNEALLSLTPSPIITHSKSIITLSALLHC